MKLNRTSLRDRAVWEGAGFALPAFDIDRVAAETRAHPAWIHFGAGNIFRAFTANVQQQLLNAGKTGTGIIAAEGYDGEIVEAICRPHDNLSVLVTLNADGTIDKTVVASVTETLTADPAAGAEWARLREIFAAPTLQMVSFTITEKGYQLRGGDGAYYPAVEADFAAGPARPASYIGKVAALLYERYRAGAQPVAMVSMDNCSHNGDRLREAVRAYTRAWTERGQAEPGFAAYIDDPARVSFPWSMIDKITPRPDESVRALLEQAGFEDAAPIVTAKNTYIAAFVNAEKPQYLVIEDAFPGGRPPLEAGGVIFTDRATVDKVEKMKVCTCLNPLHTALAIYGCLLGYTLISEEMKDPQLRRLAEAVGYGEGLPVVVDPGIVNPRAFIDEVLNERLPNPFMPDAPQRIATDTSQKLSVRFGETVKAYGARAASLRWIPLVLAGWCRYLLAVDDKGEAFTPSSDPLLADVTAHLRGIKLGDARDFHAELAPILSDARIFGVNLYEAGIGGQVETYFASLTAGIGGVRRTLENME